VSSGERPFFSIISTTRYEEATIMDLSYEEFTQYISEEDIKFIRLAFTDVYGNTKNISVMPHMMEEIYKNGMAIDADAIPGFKSAAGRGVFLHPDFTTTKILPWRPEHGKVIRAFCELKYEDDTPFELDTRKILKDAIKEAESEGVTFRFGSRMEFYLFNLDENSNPTCIPHDNAGYMDIAPLDRGENVRREICLTLERMGILPVNSHHEAGPGQNEIDFMSADPLTSADNVEVFRMVVKTVAARNGLYADFSPKPLDNKPGNGYHVNLFAQREGADIMDSVCAGILEHTFESTIFYNQYDESYKRLGGRKNLYNICWDPSSSDSVISVPATKGKDKYVQFKSPDSATNPYLVNALLIYSGLDGIRKNLTTSSYSKKVALPSNKTEAAEAALESEFVNTIFSKNLIEVYTK